MTGSCSRTRLDADPTLPIVAYVPGVMADFVRDIYSSGYSAATVRLPSVSLRDTVLGEVDGVRLTIEHPAVEARPGYRQRPRAVAAGDAGGR